MKNIFNKLSKKVKNKDKEFMVIITRSNKTYDLFIDIFKCDENLTDNIKKYFISEEYMIKSKFYVNHYVVEYNDHINKLISIENIIFKNVVFDRYQQFKNNHGVNYILKNCVHLKEDLL